MAERMQEVPKSTEELFALMETVEEGRRITVRKLIEEVEQMAERLQVTIITFI